MRRLSIIIITALFIVSCSGSSSHDGDTGNSTIDASLYYYQAQPDDVLTYTSHTVTTITGQDPVETDVTEINTFTQVSSIPAKYNYSGTIAGPYILETYTEDGETAGYTYYSLSGIEIIDDDLEHFTNIDYTTSTGEDEPEQIIIGQSYSYQDNETLFSSETGAEVGSSTFNVTQTAEKVETITVPAGSHETLKFQVTISSSETIGDTIESLTATGYTWYGKNMGMIKYISTPETTGGSITITTELSSSSIATSAIQTHSQLNPSPAPGAHFINQFSRPLLKRQKDLIR